MKQTLEEVSQKGAEGYNIVGQIIYKSGFRAGAEWHAKQSPWISVEDRLPEANTMVLTKGAYGFLICYLSTLGEWETGANVNEERLGITHWMSIPSFDEILESNRDVLERIKEKGD
jgi:hypothetical protein